jgi:hypothetical protein
MQKTLDLGGGRNILRAKYSLDVQAIEIAWFISAVMPNPPRRQKPTALSRSPP